MMEGEKAGGTASQAMLLGAQTGPKRFCFILCTTELILDWSRETLCKILGWMLRAMELLGA